MNGLPAYQVQPSYKFAGQTTACSVDPPFQPFPAKAASRLEAFSSMVIKDIDEVHYIHKGGRRVFFRLFIMLLAVGALGGLTAARYLGSKDLRSQKILTQIQADELKGYDLKKYEQLLENGTCPCISQENQWGRITITNADVLNLMAVGINSVTGEDAYNEAQCHNIVMYGSAGLPSLEKVVAQKYETYNNLSVANQQLYTDEVLFHLQTVCTTTLQQFQQQLNNDANATGLETLTSASLRTQQQLNASLSAYIADKLSQQRISWVNAYQAQLQVALSEGQSGTNTSQVRSIVTRVLGGISSPANISAVSNQTVFETIDGYIKANVVITFDSHLKSCNPRFCTSLQEKSLTTLVTEFLSTVGGLWTIVFFGVTVVWFFISLCDIPGREQSTFHAMHS